LYYQSQSAPEEKAKLIAQCAMPDREGDGVPGFELVRLHEVIKTRNISDEAALDAAVNELRQAVVSVLKDGGRVILG
jgi:hypothetical protein